MPTIGRYQLLEKLGQGGMGIVYRALDTLLQRIVAVKVISVPIDTDPEPRERFFREARAAGQLSHKNIITIHDLGEHEGQPYLAMEYLTGQDLAARMTDPQRMSLRRKLEVAAEICEGLEYAHAHGVVHRDIKPGNIFLTDSGTIKIVDFGLARLVTSELTRSNMMMGTINYMAPEQIRGERVDQRADIFSTGVVLYEVLSGRRAFEGDSVASTLYKILEKDPEPLRNIDAALPLEVVQIVDRALGQAARRALSAYERDAPRSGRLPAATCGARFPRCQPSGIVGPARVFGRTHRADTCPSLDSEHRRHPGPSRRGLWCIAGPSYTYERIGSRRGRRNRNGDGRDLDDDPAPANTRSDLSSRG